MRAMVLREGPCALTLEQRPVPVPAAGEVLVRVEACAVCRTDLHVVDGDLPPLRRPVVPGHEVVGTVATGGPGVDTITAGTRVGIPWLGGACGQCRFCAGGRENLCDAPVFTGYTRDGGFADYTLARADFVVPLAPEEDPVATALLLCAGLIGWRALVAAGAAESIGLYGFGAAAHILAQVCRWQGRRVHAFTRPGDVAAQAFARELGATWAGGSDEAPPEPLDAAILFAPAGDLVPIALGHVRKGGRVVCGGIHMSDIPRFPYALLWGERELVSVANLTRADAHAFFAIAPRIGIRTHTTRYPLEAANAALDDLRSGRLQGAAVLCPGMSAPS